MIGASPEFAALWADHDVAFRRNDRKRLNHPAVGTDSADALGLLTVIGTRRITEPTG